MSFRMRIITIEGEATQFSSALVHQLAAAFGSSATTELVALPAVVEERSSVPRAVRGAKVGRAKKTVDGDLLNDPAAREAAVLAQLAHRPMRIPELADTLCRDKADVKVMTQRLYPALAKLKKRGKVKKAGAEYALK